MKNDLKFFCVDVLCLIEIIISYTEIHSDIVLNYVLFAYFKKYIYFKIL